MEVEYEAWPGNRVALVLKLLVLLAVFQDLHGSHKNPKT